MIDKYSIEMTNPHFRTLQLSYTDSKVSIIIFLDESAIPEYDLIGSEPSSNLGLEHLEVVLKNINEWALKINLKIKFWGKEELGI